MKYSPFNKWKGLTHRKHLEAIMRGEFLPPYCVSVDPSNACTDRCVYCCAKEYRARAGDKHMPEGHLLRLADFLKDWGVDSVIIEGGGEPLLNPEVKEFMRQLRLYDIEIGLITNGYLLKGDIADCVAKNVRWCGISMDAATARIYRKMRGVDHFEQVKANVEALCGKKERYGSGIDIRCKMLIHKHNYREIAKFAGLVKDMGCSGVHIKPVATFNVEGVKAVQLTSYLAHIGEGTNHAYSLASCDFAVDVIKYKFDERMDTTVRFEKCLCTPIQGVFAADGWFHLCVNMRGREGFKFVQHFPNPYLLKRVWGGTQHKKLISQIDPKECMRCGLTMYNEIMEHCIKNDDMFWKFL